MSWARGVDENGRAIGYAVRAVCAHEGCKQKIDRGLYYVCGGMHGGDESGCGEYFCGKHLFVMKGPQLCRTCYDKAPDFDEEDDPTASKETASPSESGPRPPG